MTAVLSTKGLLQAPDLVMGLIPPSGEMVPCRSSIVRHDADLSVAPGPSSDYHLPPTLADIVLQGLARICDSPETPESGDRADAKIDGAQQGHPHILGLHRFIRTVEKNLRKIEQGLVHRKQLGLINDCHLARTCLRTRLNILARLRLVLKRRRYGGVVKEPMD